MNIEFCPDCESYPPNLVKQRLYTKDKGEFFGVECRDCGDYWEEYPED